jgi:subtilase family serine protease
MVKVSAVFFTVLMFSACVLSITSTAEADSFVFVSHMEPSEEVVFTLILRPQSAGHPANDDIETFGSRLEASGIRVLDSYGLMMTLSGNSSSIEGLFGTAMNYYGRTDQVTGSKTTYYSPEGSPAIPKEWSGMVAGIVGLDNRTMMRPFSDHEATAMRYGPFIPSASSLSGYSIMPSSEILPMEASGTPPYAPSDIRKAYGFDGLYGQGMDGKGVRIAVIAAYGSSTLENDLNKFDIDFGLPGFELEVWTPHDYVVGQDLAWAREATMDIEWVHAIAPSATIVLIVAPDSSINSMFGALNFAIFGNISDVISLSWGANEDQMSASGIRALDSLFQQAAAQGMSVFASSGDSGSYGTYLTPGPAVYPSSSPYVTSVGGTRLYFKASGGYMGEVAWSGSGGGRSIVFGRPSWQSGPLVPADGARTLPDVAMTADPIYGVHVVFNGQDVSTSGKGAGGTSLSSPLWAGLAALATQRAGGRIGLMNPSLYSVASSQNYTKDMHDISNGSNGFASGTGYDMATGLGSPNAPALLEDVAAYYGAPYWVGNGTATGNETTADSTSTSTTVSPSQNMTALEDRIAALEAKVAALEAWKAAIESWKTGTDTTIAGLLLRIALIEAKVITTTTTTTTTSTTSSTTTVASTIASSIPTTIASTTTIAAGGCGGTLIISKSFTSSGKVTCPAGGYSSCCVYETCVGKTVMLLPGQSYSRSCSHMWGADLYGTSSQTGTLMMATISESVGVSTR